MLNSDRSHTAYYGATRLLTHLGNEQAIDLLMQRLDSTPSRQKSALEALVDIGSSAVPVLVDALHDNLRYIHRSDVETSMRRQIATPLGQIGDTRAVDALVQALDDDNTNIRGQVVWALGQIGNPTATPALVEILKKDTNAKVRQRAVLALGQINTSAATPVLIDALGDENEHVRFHAQRALNQIGTPKAMKAVQAYERNR